MKKSLFLSLVFLTLASCKQERNTERSALENELAQNEVAALEDELDEMKKQLMEEQNLRLKSERDQAALMAEMQVMVSQAVESRKEAPAPVLVLDAGPSEEEIEARRVARLKAQGETFEELVTVSGQEYRDLTISRVSDVGVVFRHKGGVARVPFTDLNEAWQERFYYDDDLAMEALKNERLARARNDQAAAARMVALKEKEQRERAVDDSTKLADLAKAVEQLNSRRQPVFPAKRERIIVGPPIILNQSRANRYPSNEIYCPPIIRTPHHKVPTVRPSVHRPQRPVSRPTPIRPTTRPTSRPSRPVQRPTPVRPSTSRVR